jgi:PAS domain-containing protein
MVCVGNAPGKDEITDEQTRIFKAAFRHVDRAVRLHRELRLRDLDHDIAPERLEQMPCGVRLVDRAAKVLFANARARALIDSGSGLALQAGCLRSTNGSDMLQRLIASCAEKFYAPKGPGGETVICPSPRRSLHVTVTPLRARGNVAELPWLGSQVPVAMVTVSNPALKKWLT